jgi:hypothetical protein
MIDELIEQAWQILNISQRVTPPLLMRKLKIDGDMAGKICSIVWLRQHLEARQLAKEFLELY